MKVRFEKEPKLWKNMQARVVKIRGFRKNLKNYHSHEISERKKR